MDGQHFDELTRLVGEPGSRRAAMRALGGSVLGVVLGLGGLAGLEAKKKKHKKGKKNKKPPEPCGGDTVCTGGRFCCDDQREICCAPGDSCCNIGPDTGFCCSPPNRCAKPVGNDDAPFECCPPERQSFAFGVVRCCQKGTRSLGTEISSDDGPCCPEEKYCSQVLTGGKCCPDLAPVCLNSSTETCCTQDTACGTQCCSGLFGDCCNGECRNSDFGPWHDCGDFCCPADTTCCGSGNNGICCTDGKVCAIPCGDLPHACCTPEALANGACCNTECPPEGCGDG